MILTPYSSETARLLASPPATGAGRHLWLFKVAARLIHAGAAPAAVESRLTDYCIKHNWRDRVGQIRGDVAKIARHVADGAAPTPAAARLTWPPRNNKARRARATTPAIFKPEPQAGANAAAALAALYAPGELVCYAPDISNAHTMKVSEFAQTAAAAQFIVANPMRARTGRTLDGGLSARCKENAARPDVRRYMVIEFDTGDPLPEQCAILSSLHSPAAPLVLAVYSGGKSIHAWYNVANLSPRHKFAFFAFAVYLGADESLWDTAKLVRMPGGRRDNGNPQPILFLNPKEVKS